MESDLYGAVPINAVHQTDVTGLQSGEGVSFGDRLPLCRGKCTGTA
jgi:hypothetical protein